MAAPLPRTAIVPTSAPSSAAGFIEATAPGCGPALGTVSQFWTCTTASPDDLVCGPHAVTTTIATSGILSQIRSVILLTPWRDTTGCVLVSHGSGCTSFPS